MGRLAKRLALEEALKEKELLMDEGHIVVMYTDWHWKIDGIDVWPTVKKFMRPDERVRFYKTLSDIFKR